jgi:predicted SprT family Zn-dependent metalloprotease
MDAGKVSPKCARGVFDDLWSPEKSLPALPVLRRITARCMEIWGESEFSRRIKIGYNVRLRTTLGRAMYDSHRIELNPHLLAEHPEELIPTVVHELAHLVVHKRDPAARPHGRAFRVLMRQLGLSGKATHDLPVGHMRRKRSRYLYLHRCGDCNRSFVARKARRDCYCRACGPTMQWDILRLPDSPAGRNLLDRLMRVHRLG